MEIETFKTQIKELEDKLTAANEKLASASGEDEQNAAISEISEINVQISSLKDKYIDESSAAYNELTNKYEKAERERLQALKIASDNANKKPPEEKDPRKIIRSGFIGG